MISIPDPAAQAAQDVILLGIMMKRYGFSLRGMIKEPYYRSGSRKAAGLKHVPSKSWLQKWLKRLPMDLLDGLIVVVHPVFGKIWPPAT